MNTFSLAPFVFVSPRGLKTFRMANDKSKHMATGKRCFVTIGATAPFDSLVRAVFEPGFIEALRSAGYTELRIQYGNESGEAIFRQRSQTLDSLANHGLTITGFGFKQEGLREEMQALKGSVPQNQGMVISHAGSGSILDALRVGVPIVVVPNTDLLHNHQVELAEALAEQEYVIHGSVAALSLAVEKAEALRSKSKQWPPLRSGEERYKRGLQDVMYEEMGWQID
jgi:beta-1,4-N-acetylglucosaminyltransferase